MADPNPSKGTGKPRGRPSGSAMDPEERRRRDAEKARERRARMSTAESVEASNQRVARRASQLSAMSDDDLLAYRQSNADRESERRDLRTPAQVQQDNESRASRREAQFLRMSLDDLADHQRANADNEALRRDYMTLEEIAAASVARANRRDRQLSLMSEDELSSYRGSNADYMAQLRDLRTRDQVVQEHDARTERRRSQLDALEPDELALHHSNEAARVATFRANKPRQFEYALMNVDGSLCHVPQQHDLGPMDKVCDNCMALHFSFEAKAKRTHLGVSQSVYSNCCDLGKINPATIRLPVSFPPALLNLYTNNGFYNLLHKYNQSFALASLGYKPRKVSGRGPRVMNVEGLVYHFTHDLEELGDGLLPHYNQCWLLSTGAAIDARRRSLQLDRGILETIHHVLTDNNPHYREFRTVQEAAGDLQTYSIRFFKRQNDPSTHDLPVANEIVAALCEGDLTTERGVYIYKRNHAPGERPYHFVKYTDELVDNLTYPLLMPIPIQGWHPELKKDHTDPLSKSMTLMQYYAYLLSEREGQFNPFISSGFLSQMFIVDAACKVLQNRLDWARNNQKEIRAEMLSEVQAFVDDLLEDDPEFARQIGVDGDRAGNNEGDDAQGNVGKFVKLPQSFRGGPRYHKKNYYNSVSMVSVLGKPSLFITMTCNPKWPEIVGLVEEGQVRRENIPRVAKVFDGKVKALIEEIDKKQIFGRCLGYTGVTEFQKRGLPHGHFIFWLDIPTTPEAIDRVIRAEIPDPESEPRLHELVKDFMMHNMCGPDNPTAQCMRPVQQRIVTRVEHVPAGGALNTVNVAADADSTNQAVPVDDGIIDVDTDQIESANDARDRVFSQSQEVIEDVAENAYSSDDDTLLGSDINQQGNAPSAQGVDSLRPGEEHMDVDPQPEGANVAAGFASQGDAPERIQCRAHFPKKFASHTDLKGQFPIYRRRNDGRTVRVRYYGTEYVYDNTRVVPYNPYLLLRFNCHINVEMVANSGQACRYLFAYIHKGDAMTNIAFHNNERSRDEIAAFSATKCLASMEAMYIIHHLKTVWCSHTIQRLQVHLPNRQMIYWANRHNDPDVAARDAAARNAQMFTTLTAWFRLNQLCAHVYHPDNVARFADSYPPYTHYFEYETVGGQNRRKTVTLSKDSRDFHYFEIPKHFTFHEETGMPKYWDIRKDGKTRIIGRMYHVLPSGVNQEETERYYLRLLLLNVTGHDTTVVPGDGFRSLRTFEGVEYETFQAVCRARGLLTADSGHIECLEEARRAFTPRQLRGLFALILRSHDVSNPEELYRQFMAAMYDDYIRPIPKGLGLSEEAAQERLYLEIELLCRDFDITFGQLVPRPEHYATDLHVLHTRQERDELLRLAQQRVAQFNVGQTAAFNVIYSNLQKPSTDPTKKRLFFLNGSAGVGKTFLYKGLHGMVTEELGLKVLCVALSGIAAFLLPGGRTAHSAFKLRFNMDESNYSANMRAQTREAEELKGVDLIIWDEISMVPKWALMAVDDLLRDLMNSTLPFGGKTLIVGGDFRQIVPVVTGDSNRHTVFNICVKRCHLWPLFECLKLTENVRCKDPEFQRYLLSIGNGTEGPKEAEDDNGTKTFPVPSDLYEPSGLNRLIDFVFDPATLRDTNKLASSAILAPTNVDANRVNQKVLERLVQANQPRTPEQHAVYLSSDKLLQDSELDPAAFPDELLHEQNGSGFPPHVLELEVGAVVCLMRNLSVNRGLSNGTRMIIVRFHQHSVLCRIATSIEEGEEGELVAIPRIPFNIDASETPIGVSFVRRQFPIKLAFGMTLHKSQGQTLHKVGLYLRTNLFSHGQLYVGMSRARERKNLRVFTQRGRFSNIVWDEVLREVIPFEGTPAADGN